METKNNYVLIKQDKIFNNNILGTDVNPQYDPAKHINTWGEVVAVGNLYYNKKDKLNSMPHDTRMELSVGDKVLMTNYGVMVALGAMASEAKHDSDEYRASYFTDDAYVYFFIPYYEIIAKNSLIPINGNVLVNPIDEDYDEMLPQRFRGKKANLGRVIAVGEYNKDYLFGDVAVMPNVGDVIIYHKLLSFYVEDNIYCIKPNKAFGIIHETI